MPRKWAIGTVKTTTASTSRSRSSTFVRWRRHRGVTQRQIASRVALSKTVSSGESSSRRRYRSPLSRARPPRRAAKLSPSAQVGFGAVRHHGDSTGRPRYGVTIRSAPTSYRPFQSCHQAGVQPYRKSRSIADATARILGREKCRAFFTGSILPKSPAESRKDFGHVGKLERSGGRECSDPLEQVCALFVRQLSDEAH